MKISNSFYFYQKVSLWVLLLFSSVCIAQQSSQDPLADSFDFNAEVTRMVNIPNSPEAQAFAKYGDIPVNMYSGTPNIGVPIYTYQGREMNLPINMSYDASGIKVEQLAGQVGLGWNLAVGGRVSRVANGAPDDYITATSPYSTCFNTEVRDKMNDYLTERKFFTSMDEVKEYFAFMSSMNTNEYDTQPDLFSLNAIGINDYIAFDLNSTPMKPIALNNPRIKVDYTYETIGIARNITTWTVTNEDGTKYYFENAEVSESQGNDVGGVNYGLSKKYNSSWVLTRVESANKKDTYIFSYFDNDFWTQNFSISGYSSTSYTIDENTPLNNPPGVDLGFIPTYRIKAQFLNSISHNGTEIISMTYQNRDDIGQSKALSEIAIKQTASTDLKKFGFTYSYFGNASSNDAEDKRLKLDEIQILSDDNSVYQKYTFDYNSPASVPPLTSRGQDYMGYYNGQSNQVLYPTLTYGNYTFNGANRDPVFANAIVGTLSKINYPTGGYTTFDFESHTSPALPTDVDNSVTEVTHGILSLTGFMDGGLDCNSQQATCGCNDGWCMDLYPGQPTTSSTIFKAPNDGNYTLKYLETFIGGSSVPQNFKRIAIVHKIGTTSANSNCTNLSAVPLGNIIDLSSGNILIPNNQVVFNRDEDRSLLDGNGKMNLYLSAGCYQITFVNPNDTETMTLAVSSLQPTINSPVELNEQTRAGIRIKTVKSWTATNELAIQKRYRYKLEDNFTDTGKSSGVILFKPTFEFFTESVSEGGQVAGSGECVYKDVLTLHRTGVSSGGSTPHIAYAVVHEEIVEDNLTNLYLKHTFNLKAQSGLYSTGVTPNISFYSADYSTGKENSTSSYNASGVVSASSTEYGLNSYDYFLSKGLYLKSNSKRAYDIAYGYQVGNVFTYDYDRMEYGSFGGTGTGSTDCAFSYPLACDSPLNDCTISAVAPTFDMFESSIAGRIGGVVEQQTTQYFPEGNIISSESFTYDNGLEFLLKHKESTNSSGETLKQTFYYPLEFTGDPIMDGMISKNQIASPVKTISENDKGYNIQESIYKQVGTEYYVSTVKTSTNNIGAIADINNPPAASDNRVYYDYYPNGNVQMAYQIPDDSPGLSIIDAQRITTFIWGYNNRYPIAKIENAKYSDVSSIVGNLEILSNADNDRTTDYTGSEGALRLALDQLRSEPALQNSLISTYTYDPNIGVTSMTDPRGNSVYYVYDKFHRLELVLDKDGKVLSQNEYNYKTN